MSQTTQRRTLCYRLLSYGDFMVRQDCEVSLEIALWYVAMRVRLCTFRIDLCRLWIRRSCTKTRLTRKTIPTSRSPFLSSFKMSRPEKTIRRKILFHKNREPYLLSSKTFRIVVWCFLAAWGRSRVLQMRKTEADNNRPRIQMNTAVYLIIIFFNFFTRHIVLLWYSMHLPWFKQSSVQSSIKL